MRSSIFAAVCCAASLVSPTLASRDRTYHNPILPGWHSDPSCAYVSETETFFCVTSTFLAFPGLPLYSSKDLQNWELASNIFNRPTQIPDLARTEGQQGGIYAATLRYREGTFYLIVSFLGPEINGLVFTSTDPYDDNAWSDPLVFPVYGIDPDIFWDDDGSVYVTSADSNVENHYSLDLETGEIGPVTYLWNGTGGAYPEGPHLYRKDGYYYLLIAEGGTETNHAVTMARSKSRAGPWEPCPHNPVLTNRNTTQYFQTVGHADLFEDGSGNWWAVALSTRSGPQWENYPMGRETILTPVIWEEGEWPVIEPVRGVMSGPLPAKQRVRNPITKPDHLTFAPGSVLPAHLVYWRLPDESSYVVSPKGHPHTLRLAPSTFGPSFNGSSQTDPVTFVARRQTDTLFSFNVDIEFRPDSVYVEAGISLFLTQQQHVDLSIAEIPNSHSGVFRVIQLKTYGQGNYDGPMSNVTLEVPRKWGDKKVSLTLQALDDTTYTFSAALASQPRKKIEIGSADARLLSGGTGQFTGTLVGVYASRGGHAAGSVRKGGKGDDFAYFSNWRYEGQGQKVDYDLTVPSY